MKSEKQQETSMKFIGISLIIIALVGLYSPKEKAIELYDNFRNENSVMTSNIRAKKQALICVKEILFQYSTLNSELINWMYKSEKVVFWQSVKRELEDPMIIFSITVAVLMIFSNKQSKR